MTERFSVQDAHDGLPTVELRDRDADSLAVLAPGRGGIVTRFTVGGRELLYLDRATLLDASKNVRGGFPVLFPTPGKLSGDAWSWRGRSGSMKQHGFARTMPWQIVERRTADAAHVTLALSSNEATRSQYPWDFELSLGFLLHDTTLRIDVAIENRSADPMPFGFGLHPYFAVPQADKAVVRIPTDATRAYDNAAHREIAFAGFDLTRPEVDLHLADHRAPAIALQLADGARLELTGSGEVRRWVVWTLAGKDFVCLEPWTCPGDALNRGEDLLLAAPGETRTLWIETKFVVAAG